MTGSERNRFVKKEELGPTATAHHLAPAPLIVEDANQPRFSRLALAEQCSRCRVVDDAAVADECASLRYRDDISEWRHPVLQGPLITHIVRPIGFIHGIR
jgi:hypothetical protein